jgi:hypothetical protein
VAAYDNFAKKLIEVETYSVNVNGTVSFPHIAPKTNHVFNLLNIYDSTKCTGKDFFVMRTLLNISNWRFIEGMGTTILIVLE